MIDTCEYVHSRSLTRNINGEFLVGVHSRTANIHHCSSGLGTEKETVDRDIGTSMSLDLLSKIFHMFLDELKLDPSEAVR